MRDVVYLNPGEIAQFRKQVEGFKSVLRNSRNSVFKAERNIDRDAVIKNMRRKEAILTEQTAPHVAGKERDKMYQRQKKLETFIQAGMPTRDEYMGKRKTNDDGHKYQEASENIVNKQVKWELEKAKSVREWKRIKRTLEPDNPGVTNVEQLRPVKKGKKKDKYI